MYLTFTNTCNLVSVYWEDTEDRQQNKWRKQLRVIKDLNAEKTQKNIKMIVLQ